MKTSLSSHQPQLGPYETDRSKVGLKTTVTTSFTSTAASKDPTTNSASVRKRDPNQPSRKTHKRCVKCKEWKTKDNFGKQPTSCDGLQSYCKMCKNALGKQRRAKNTRAYLRHHIATRAMDQLGAYFPEAFAKNVEDYLGYRIGVLIEHLRTDLQEREGKERSLRKALNEGYHVDHIYPLSRYKVITDDGVDWEEFRRCWHPSNLRAISKEENLKKGAAVEEGEDDGPA